MCMIDGCDEFYRHYSERRRKARTKHRCSECGRTIQPKEIYSYVSAIGDRWDTWKTCAHCLVAQLWLQRNCGGFMHASVFEDLQEHLEIFPALAVLTTGIETKWIANKEPEQQGNYQLSPTIELEDLPHYERNQTQ